jgi:hypothetical protein
MFLMLVLFSGNLGTAIRGLRLNKGEFYLVKCEFYLASARFILQDICIYMLYNINLQSEQYVKKMQKKRPYGLFNYHLDFSNQTFYLCLLNAM